MPVTYADTSALERDFGFKPSNGDIRKDWVHWYFTFDDNAGLTHEKREQLLSGTPKGTKLYKNKILGLRGRAIGLVFDLQDKHIISISEAKNTIKA